MGFYLNYILKYPIKTQFIIFFNWPIKPGIYQYPDITYCMSY